VEPDQPYCQFGKRFLDGFSWIAPVTNNRLGDALNIEFVHEHLFFIEGDRVSRNIGYSEKGQRFSEEEYGKPINTLDDIAKNGYWLVGRKYHPAAAEEALGEIDDGYYYSFFSNQCQDWADRLRRKIERIEKARGLAPLAKTESADKRFWIEQPPTVPASAAFGLLAIGLGVGSFLAPAVAAHRSIWILALFLIVSGISEIVYACHGRAWSQILRTIIFALLNIVAGGALLLDTQNVAGWAGGLFGLAFGFNGLAHIGVAIRSRPFVHYLGTLLTGLGMFIGAVLLFTRTVGERDVVFGVIIGANLILGGFSTLWLHWTTSQRSPIRRKDSGPSPGLA
jgi:uncharacterized membrane protein HdeD (DUF308 family)